MPALDPIPIHFIGAVKDEWQLYSDNHADYSIGPSIGFGASSIVYSATFQPPGSAIPVPCALKVVDLDRLPPQALRLLMQETQLMSLSKHPNVLRVRGTWMEGHKLYIALRLMNAGSAADVMRYAWPGGMEEEVVKCILKQALEGLNYLHINGLIHRDVKAANLLIDDDGTVLLGDLGVAAPLWDNSEESSSKRPSGVITVPFNPRKPRQLGKRKSFVGTPCWMAPEVIQGRQYDASADIWSFGITAIELTQGRPPRSREPPSTVLTRVVTSPPPKLDRRSAVHSYSQAFCDIIEWCLHKDPTKRPSAAELLATPFFKSAKKKGHLVGNVLKALPPLSQRQERRKLPSLMTFATMESWDFGGNSGAGSLVGSPTTSVYGHHHVKRGLPTLPADGLSEVNDELIAAGGVYPNMTREEGAAAYASRIRANNRSRSHSRGVSWAGSDDMQVSLHSFHPAPIEENDAPISPSPEAGYALPDTSDERTPVIPPAFPVIPLVSSTENISSSPPTSVSSSGTQGGLIDIATDHEQITTPSSAPPTSKLWRKLVGHARKDSVKDSGRFTVSAILPSKEKPDSLGEVREDREDWGNGGESLRSRAKLSIGRGMRNSMHMGAGIVRTMGRVTGGTGK